MMPPTTIIGIDGGLKYLAVTVLDGDTQDIRWIAPDRDIRDQWRRIFHLRLQLLEFLREMRLSHKQLAVWVEAPMVTTHVSSTIPLAQVVAAVRITCDDLSIPCFDVYVSSWKKEVIGKGNASKEEIIDILRVIQPGFAAVLKANKIPKGAENDFYDSLAIALYGRRIVSAGELGVAA